MDRTSIKRKSGSRSKKCRFHGNRFLNSTNNQSASAKKLSNLSKKVNDAESEIIEADRNFSGYRLLDISFLLQQINQHLSCKKCGGEVKMEESLIIGLSSKFEINCKICKNISTFRSCPMLGKNQNVAEINRRAVYAMRCIGQGYGGLATFCGVMDLPVPLSRKSYDVIVQRLLMASKDAATKSMKAAAFEERSAAESECIIVSGDGTWKTRGHSSQIGVCTIIGDLSGKIIDAEVMSKFCKGCEAWKGDRKGRRFRAWHTSHAPFCMINHTGSSGKMESDGMIRIFCRSKQERNVVYAEYIGDGDSKTYASIVDAQPYGTNVHVKKIECVGHIQKRMGTQLRKLKTSMAKKKLSDGKGLSGRGRLTDRDINQLTIYYGNAIRGNRSSLADMRMAIWAIYHHKRATDDNPSHDFCPKGEESWCSYQKAVAANSVDTYTHTNSLPTAVMDCVRPVFLRLSSPELLRRCLGGKTQNKNESINSLIWKFCPKMSGCGRKIAELAVNESIIAYNDGRLGRLKMMQALGLQTSRHFISAAETADTTRIETAEKRCKSSSLEARRAKRLKKLATIEREKLEEGLFYDAGNF